MSLDIEGAICDECGRRVGPHGCCATARERDAWIRGLEAELVEARAVLDALEGKGVSCNAVSS